VSETRFFREGLAEIFGRDPSLSIAGAAAGIVETLEHIVTARPDIILLDTALTNGLSAASRIRQAAPDAHVVALAIAEREEDVIAWAEAGATGYLPRGTALADLGGVLHQILDGRLGCSGSMAESLLRRARDPVTNDEKVGSFPASLVLTRRERQIARLMGDGFSNKDIARKLRIAVSTAKSHVHNLLDKLKLQRRSQVAAWLHGRPSKSVGRQDSDFPVLDLITPSQRKRINVATGDHVWRDASH
jgi:DNA-binding NarL/FixJ family response regulator